MVSEVDGKEIGNKKVKRNKEGRKNKRGGV
jgi:hypothetical protein